MATSRRDPERSFSILRGYVPADWSGLVGIYPQSIFRPRQVITRRTPGVCLFVDGRRHPCDGSIYQLDEMPSVAVGSFLAFHVENRNESPIELELQIWGTVLPGTNAGGELGASFRRGPIVGRTPAAPPPCPDMQQFWRAELEALIESFRPEAETERAQFLARSEPAAERVRRAMICLRELDARLPRASLPPAPASSP